MLKIKWVISVGVMALCLSVAQAELIAQWDFENTLTNSVNSAYDAACKGSGVPQYSSDAKSGSSSLLFSNPAGNLKATDMLIIAGGGDWAGTSNWTFSAWVKPVTLETTQTVFSARGESTVYKLYSQLRGAICNTYYDDDGTNALASVGGVSWGGVANNWYRWTVVFDAANHTVTEYRDSKDGVGGLTMLKARANYFTPTTLSNFQIGSVGGFFGFQGYMDDVRIYNTALSAAEVDAISSK